MWTQGEERVGQIERISTDIYILWASLVAQTVEHSFTCNAGDVGLNPGLGRYPGERNGNTFWYACLGNPMAKGPW